MQEHRGENPAMGGHKVRAIDCGKCSVVATEAEL